MHIDFECSGGFANLRLTYHADTNELQPELAEDILKLVESAEFFDIKPSEVASTSAGPPDVFFYRISLAEGSKMQSILCTDVTAPATLHPLLALMRKLALSQGRKGK